MTHAYSAEIQTVISEKIATAEKGMAQAKDEGNVELRNYYEGQIEELQALRNFLTDRIDLETQKYY